MCFKLHPKNSFTGKNFKNHSTMVGPHFQQNTQRSGPKSNPSLVIYHVYKLRNALDTPVGLPFSAIGSLPLSAICYMWLPFSAIHYIAIAVFSNHTYWSIWNQISRVSGFEPIFAVKKTNFMVVKVSKRFSMPPK